MAHPTTQEPDAHALDAIRQTAMDYVQGWYEADAERMRRSLHPELAKRAILRDSRTGAQRFSHLSQERMVTKTQQGGGTDVPPEKRYYDVRVLDICSDIACARVESYEYVDYLHLAHDGEAWKIVNVLWTFRTQPMSQA